MADKKHYWFVRWIEKYADGTMQAYRTAVTGKTIDDALAAAEANLVLYRNANPGTETMIYSVSMNFSQTGRDILGKRVQRVLPNYVMQAIWPDEEA